MSSGSPRSRLWRIVDQLTLVQLALGAAILIILPALAYWGLSQSTESSAIALGNIPDKSFLDALYFSFVNAVTVGSQDIVARGWSRLILCAQVTGGLTLAGLAIAKLTSAHGRHMRTAIRNAEGTWIEPCGLSDGKVLVSLSRFFEENGELCYGGENFDIEGNPMGFFSSQFISASQRILNFNYTNHGSCPEYFGEGVTSHWFVQDPESGRWNRHHATCRDFDKGMFVRFEGYRATDEEIRIIHGPDRDARIKLIRSYVGRVGHGNAPSAEAVQPIAIVAS